MPRRGPVTPPRSEKTGVLVVQSVNDSITDRRIDRADRSPLLAHYRVSYAFLVELNEEQRRLEPEELMRRIAPSAVDATDLLSRLDRQIEDVRPAFLIVHAGFIFCEIPTLVISVFEELKRKHGSIRFGLEAAPWVPTAAESPIFERNDEMDELILNLFGRV
jgi:hypothetical protein